MGDPAPLDADEAAFWRPLTRVMLVLPRVLDDRFRYETGLTMTDYTVLVSLSEAPGRQLRLSGLAKATALSLSRISRVVDALTRRGLVRKWRCDQDGRSFNTALTDDGHAALVAAYPGHLARVRSAVFDRLSAEDVQAAGPILTRLAAALDQQGLSSARGTLDEQGNHE